MCEFFFCLAIYSNTHPSVNGGFISDHLSSSKFVYCIDMILKPVFFENVVFEEGVLMVSYKADEILCVLYAVLHNLPVPY
jgi:hypothetical protein